MLDRFVEIKAASGAHINPLMIMRINRATIRGDKTYLSSFTKRFSLNENKKINPQVLMLNNISGRPGKDKDNVECIKAIHRGAAPKGPSKDMTKLATIKPGNFPKRLKKSMIFPLYRNIASRPINVIDKQGNKDVIPDPEQRHLIVKMIELYVTGNYSLRQITEMMKELGLKNKQGGYVSHSKIADALKDPFYYGVMKAKGELYPHRHKPIISHDLFQRAQEVRLGHNKKPFQYAAKPFIFRGMITCGHCGCLVSPEIKKGKYVYYSCTNAKRTCYRD